MFFRLLSLSRHIYNYSFYSSYSFCTYFPIYCKFNETPISTGYFLTSLMYIPLCIVYTPIILLIFKYFNVLFRRDALSLCEFTINLSGQIVAYMSWISTWLFLVVVYTEKTILFSISTFLKFKLFLNS